ncbi:MAG: dienelactone hydrolase family protein [Vicinamibacterales bacterium]
MTQRLLLAVATLVACVLPLGAQQRPPSRANGADALFARFWAADDPDEAAAVGRDIVRAGLGFDEVLTRLRRGRPYEPAPTGTRQMVTTVAGASVENTVDVPADYDASRSWPLRVQLHGGVGRPLTARGNAGARNRIPSDGEIVIHPRAWGDAAWWHAPQVDNVLRLVDRVARTYNVDESRIYVTGISDGGTGVYFLGMRTAGRWSACLPLNGHPMVLANPDTRVDGELFIGNLANCPVFIVNGGKDPLYPADSVRPLVATMQRAGVAPVFHVQPDAGHNTAWWPDERPAFERFVADHPRAAHPERVSWETERTDRYNRMRWLVVDALGAGTRDVALPDENRFRPTPQTGEIQMFPRRRPSGRVDVVRTGNTFEARSRGVRAFTLLLSPDVVDFSRPIRVTVNGVVAFEGTVRPQVATLIEWAARDNDRTTLYGAALAVRTP